jgi:DNA-binding MarR family transcriptional regulator
VTDTAGRLAFAVGKLTRRLRVARGGLSHGLLSALVTVAKHGPIRLADLAQVELVSAPTVTRLVAELEAQSLVSRATDPADGRASLIEVTEAGLDAVQVARRANQRIIADLLAPLSAEDIAAIETALPAIERMIGID